MLDIIPDCWSFPQGVLNLGMGVYASLQVRTRARESCPGMVSRAT